MKTFLLLAAALLTSGVACDKTQISGLGQARGYVIAATQSDKTTSKAPTPVSPNTPAKKTAPKERERPTPPAHLFM